MMQTMDVSRDPLLLGSIRNENQRILHLFLKKGTLIEIRQHTASRENARRILGHGMN